MRIQYYGHSCFLITTDSGMRILTDPCDPTTGYTLKNIRCDCVTVSHSHFDHSYTDAACGSPAILESGADLFEKRLQIRGHVKELLYESHDGRNNGSKVSIPLDMTANQKSWDTFLDELDSGTFIEIDNVNDIGLYDSERQADLFIKKDDKARFF